MSQVIFTNTTQEDDTSEFNEKINTTTGVDTIFRETVTEATEKPDVPKGRRRAKFTGSIGDLLDVLTPRKRGAVEKIVDENYPHIYAAKKPGVSWQQIAEVFTQAGQPVKEKTLASVFFRMWIEYGDAPMRERKKKAAAETA